MDPVIILSILGGIILILLVVGAPIKPIRFVGHLVVKLIVGALFLFFVNVFGSFLDFHIPINGVTATISGFLGIPGVALLILVKHFLI